MGRYGHDRGVFALQTETPPQHNDHSREHRTLKIHRKKKFFHDPTLQLSDHKIKECQRWYDAT